MSARFTSPVIPGDEVCRSSLLTLADIRELTLPICAARDVDLGLERRGVGRAARRLCAEDQGQRKALPRRRCCAPHARQGEQALSDPPLRRSVSPCRRLCPFSVWACSAVPGSQYPARRADMVASDTIAISGPAPPRTASTSFSLTPPPRRACPRRAGCASAPPRTPS